MSDEGCFGIMIGSLLLVGLLISFLGLFVPKPSPSENKLAMEKKIFELLGGRTRHHPDRWFYNLRANIKKEHGDLTGAEKDRQIVNELDKNPKKWDRWCDKRLRQKKNCLLDETNRYQ